MRNTYTCARDMANEFLNNEKYVLVTNEDLLEEKEKKAWKNENPNWYRSPKKLKGRGDRKNGIWSEYYDEKTGEIYNIFLSEATKEILPNHFREAKSYNIIVQGLSTSSKTTYLMQLAVELNRILGHENLMFVSDEHPKYVHPVFKENKRRYLLGQFPEATNVHSFQCTRFYFCDVVHGSLILNIMDVPGEVEPSVKTTLLQLADDIWFFVDGNALNDPLQLERTKERFYYLVSELKHRTRKICLSVIVTKADVLNLQMENTLVKIGDETYMTVHKNGFNLKHHHWRSKEIEGRLKKRDSSFTNYINSRFAHVAYFVIASVNKSCSSINEYMPRDRQMFRVEEPLLYFLVRHKMYDSK